MKFKSLSFFLFLLLFPSISFSEDEGVFVVRSSASSEYVKDIVVQLPADVRHDRDINGYALALQNNGFLTLYTRERNETSTKKVSSSTFSSINDDDIRSSIKNVENTLVESILGFFDTVSFVNSYKKELARFISIIVFPSKVQIKHSCDDYYKRVFISDNQICILSGHVRLNTKRDVGNLWDDFNVEGNVSVKIYIMEASMKIPSSPALIPYNPASPASPGGKIKKEKTACIIS